MPPPLHASRIYILFFLYIEPLSALVGAYYAYFLPTHYLHLLSFPPTTTTTTTTTSAPTTIPLTTQIALTQLANLYLLFCLNEALVLRSTRDLRMWRTLLFGLLVADFGHLWSMRGLGWRVFVEVWRWNAMVWGSVGFVYVGASMRMAFLGGVGVRGR